MLVNKGLSSLWWDTPQTRRRFPGHRQNGQGPRTCQETRLAETAARKLPCRVCSSAVIWERRCRQPKSKYWNAFSISDLQSLGDIRHRSSGKLLVSARPEPTLFFCMASTFDSPEPSSARFLKLVKVETDRFKSPSRGTRTARISRPDVLVKSHKGNHAILREDREKISDVVQVFRVVFAASRLVRTGTGNEDAFTYRPSCSTASHITKNRTKRAVSEILR